ncbi:MAG TPA: Ig-like domain-containing protein [Mycobacteriales bacterium]|nr:Ig-like domain-containing protein [Mycobacteriales bacterium]
MVAAVAPFAAMSATAVAPSGITTLLSPGEGATVGGDVTFSWTAVPGAAKYRVQVSRSELFGTTLYSADTRNLHATPQAALPADLLFWRVAPMDASSNLGTYTQGSFTRTWAAAPEVMAPADGAPLEYPKNPLLFTWQPLTGAQKYNIQVDDDINFVGSPTYVTNNTSYTLTDPQTNDQQFFWRVQGVSGSVLSPWSEPRSYTVNWPTRPVLVAQTPPVTDVVLQWSPVDGAASYELEVSPNPDFANNITIDVVTKGTRYSPPETLKNGSYYWRVRARDGKTTAPNYGPWSNLINGLPAQFTRVWGDRPALDYPVVEPSVDRLEFRWSAVPYASHYQIDVAEDKFFSTYWTCTTNQTSFTPYAIAVGFTLGPVPPGKCDIGVNTLPVGVPLWWRVRGMDGPGPGADPVWGEYSQTGSFTYTNNGAPQMTGPADHAEVATPHLSWDPVMGVGRYRVTVRKGTSNVTGSPFTTFATSLTPDKLVAGETYTWIVQTIDDEGRLGLVPGEGMRTFKYVPLEGAGALQLLGPVEDYVSQLAPPMAWTPVVGAAKYQVMYRPLNAVVDTALGETSATSFTYAGAPPSGKFEWYVKALDLTNTVIAQSLVSSFEVGDLVLVSGLVPARCVDTTCAPSPQTPRLTWTPQLHVGAYEVTIATSANFTTIVRRYRTPHPSLTPRESLPDHTAGTEAYYWFVRPCRSAKDAEGCGQYDVDVFPTSGAFRKRSLPVKLLSPVDGATVPAAGSTDHENITFTWEEYFQTNSVAQPPAAQGAKKYRVRVYTTANADAVPIDTGDVDQTTYTPHAKTYPEGPIYWEVAALDGSNNELTRSERRLVTKATPKPVQLHPAADAVVSGTPHLAWTAQPNTKTYDVEVYSNGDIQYSPGNKVNLGVSPVLTRISAFAPTSSIPAGAYAWRVRSLDIDNRPGPWSSGRLFTVTAQAPTPQSPPSGTAFRTDEMLFTWSTVTGAAKYRFEASSSPSFTPLLDLSGTFVDTVMPAWAPTGLPKQYPDGTIYWRVSTLNGSGAVVGTSDTWTVVRDVTAPKVLTKTPTLNAPITGGAFTVTFSEPVQGVSPTTFGMKVSSTGNVVPGTTTPGVDTATTTATFRPSAPLTPGETYTLTVSDGVTDAFGNRLTPLSWTLRTALTVDSIAPVVKHYWDRDGSSSASGGAYLASRTPGAKVSYQFTGTSASILGRRHTDGGYGEVWVDGVKKSTVTFYSSVTRWKQTIWSISGLPNTKHRVELRVLNTKPSASSGTWVYPDAFKHGVTVLEETSSAVVQAHRNVALGGAYGGSYALAAHTASGDNASQPYLTLTFKGTGISWAGFRSASGGQARVYVDNVAKALVDTYGSPSTSAGQLWRITGLPNGTHTLKILVTGTRRTGSSGYNVTFDSFTVV